ncbi:hypothetical protein [Paenibacillus sp. OV219]|uniref:hypothetical protein n=1 Tax=Paenibacillus sp. OV219 TaxID=1884377 RepID=UPI0008B8ED0F|nr:hypothetical protein [Paenibacillus sp. OV219]SEN19943.1 hypothetical protein SAMN05518847_102397 [Paenibacillus sp. OV219]
MNKVLAEFGAYGSALAMLGYNTNDYYSEEDARIVGNIIDSSLTSEEEAKATIDYYIAQFKSSVSTLVKGVQDAEPDQ